MNAIYNTCYADPWVKVAIKLHKEHHIEPVYWIGYDDDNSVDIIPEVFPNAIYHHYYDAWAGNFPSQIDENNSETYINIDFLKENASYELQALKMMDRMDPLGNCFNFSMRIRHFRNLIRKWLKVVEMLKPDIVISASVPHRVFDYALFLVCTFKKIPFISFAYGHFKGYILPLQNIQNISEEITNEYTKLKYADYSKNQILSHLPVDVSEYYLRMQSNYTQGKPEFIDLHDQLDRESNNLFGLIKKFIADSGDLNLRNLFNKNGFIRSGIPYYGIINDKSLNRRHVSVFNYSIAKLKTNYFKQKLKRHYNKFVSVPNFKEKYVYLSLHYQPEATTSPLGDIFVDQSLILDVLSNHLPLDYKIYVKEHPAQFHSHREGHSNRIMNFYDDIVLNERVKLIPLDYDPFELIRNSIAVFTISGSAGWEAMVHGKPVVSFGLSWYEKYDGVLKITDEASANRIASFIYNFRFDELNLLAYLAAFSNKAVKAYYYRGLKEKMNQSEDECVDNLINALIKIAKTG